VQKYRCHKIVEAQDLAAKDIRVLLNDNGSIQVWPKEGEVLTIPANVVNSRALDEIENGYLVKYTDGYISWSPREVFEDGYAAIPPDAR
jgi:hypothetical protein